MADQTRLSAGERSVRSRGEGAEATVPRIDAETRKELRERLLTRKRKTMKDLEAGRSMVHRNEARLEVIDAALRRLDHRPETYGCCESCGSSIDLDRLRTVPWTLHCDAHGNDAA